MGFNIWTPQHGSPPQLLPVWVIHQVSMPHNHGHMDNLQQHLLKTKQHEHQTDWFPDHITATAVIINMCNVAGLIFGRLCINLSSVMNRAYQVQVW